MAALPSMTGRRLGGTTRIRRPLRAHCRNRGEAPEGDGNPPRLSVTRFCRRFGSTPRGDEAAPGKGGLNEATDVERRIGCSSSTRTKVISATSAPEELDLVWQPAVSPGTMAKVGDPSGRLRAGNRPVLEVPGRADHIWVDEEVTQSSKPGTASDKVLQLQKELPVIGQDPGRTPDAPPHCDRSPEALPIIRRDIYHNSFLYSWADRSARHRPRLRSRPRAASQLRRKRLVHRSVRVEPSLTSVVESPPEWRVRRQFQVRGSSKSFSEPPCKDNHAIKGCDVPGGASA